MASRLSATKPLGIVLFIIGLIALIIERLRPFAFIHRLSLVQHHALFQFITLFGLFGLTVADEKAEDERTHYLRMRAFQLTFTYLVSILLASSLAFNFGTTAFIQSSTLFIYPSMGLVFYLVIFHASIRFNFVGDYLRMGRHIGSTKGGFLMIGIYCFALLVSLLLVLI